MRVANYIKFFIWIHILCCSYMVLSQSQQDFQRKIKDNDQLFQENIDKAFGQIDVLLKEAVTLKDSVSELKLLERKCWYYYSKKDYNGLITVAGQLQKKAEEYNDVQMQGMAHICFAETYSVNELYDEAIRELEKALKILEKGDEKNPKVFFTKMNALGSFVNVYNDKGEPEKSIEKLWEVIKQYDKLENPEDAQKYQYVNYANLALTYLLFDVVNAEYYALKSIGLKPKDTPDDKIMATNYFVLGKANKESHNYEKSLDYFLKSYELGEKIGGMLNEDGLYKELVEVYTVLGNKEEAKVFEMKLKEYELSVLQSKYNSLHKILDHKPEIQQPDKNANNHSWVIGIIVLTLLLVIFGFLRYKKQKNVSSDNYNDNLMIEETSAEYGTLLEMIQKDDPAFMFAFEKLFPNFSEKLLAINPQLIKSEIEFCALLKLNLSTKKISQLKFIETRTVQNKKHRIRKKLHIPTSTDIYNWFDAL